MKKMGYLFYYHVYFQSNGYQNVKQWLFFVFSSDDSKKLVNYFLSTNELYPGPILQSNGMDAIFQKKSQKNVKKGQNIWKFGQKCSYKILKKF